MGDGLIMGGLFTVGRETTLTDIFTLTSMKQSRVSWPTRALECVGVTSTGRCSRYVMDCNVLQV